ncbi:CENPB DNA-binding domain containing protein 1-like 45 [Homarus americanus]|uniref:CENPB DNA-binding domain containing protein 1-like 45 n=1 Tax=Homarus americanus TaxID=6706 RepID=A0A8J5N574_HOMAM|nr:CENPB DNA-binding domain containing protein 1-like 45 [Homarus americanus]
MTADIKCALLLSESNLWTIRDSAEKIKKSAKSGRLITAFKILHSQSLIIERMEQMLSSWIEHQIHESVPINMLQYNFTMEECTLDHLKNFEEKSDLVIHIRLHSEEEPSQIAESHETQTQKVHIVSDVDSNSESCHISQQDMILSCQQTQVDNTSTESPGEQQLASREPVKMEAKHSSGSITYKTEDLPASWPTKTENSEGPLKLKPPDTIREMDKLDIIINVAIPMAEYKYVLQGHYQVDVDFVLKIRILPALAFIPQDGVVDAFETLQDNMSPEADPVVDYFKDTHIGRQHQHTGELHVSAGGPAPPKRKRYQDSTARIATTVQDFENRHVLEFLRAIAHNLEFNV